MLHADFFFYLQVLPERVSRQQTVVDISRRCVFKQPCNISKSISKSNWKLIGNRSNFWWVLFFSYYFLGGWYCFNKENCDSRYETMRRFMSSSKWPQTKRGQFVVVCFHHRVEIRSCFDLSAMKLNWIWCVIKTLHPVISCCRIATWRPLLRKHRFLSLSLQCNDCNPIGNDDNE